ncbi:MAG: glycosyltransferase family 4 protein [Gemmatimonadetes bacterium]|nr:glycosyltransferase family 4 protein [Gemmatimonadota bacterium]
MRILLLNWQDRLNPLAGGAETHLHEIFGRLARRGHSVTLLASGWDDAPRQAELDGIQVHRCGSRYTFSTAAPRYYRRHLSRLEFDVVVEALNKVPLFSPLWARPLVVLLVHHLFGRTAFQEAPLPIAALTWLLERPLARVYGSVLVQAISTSTADDLVERGLRRRAIEVIYPGVDLDFFVPDEDVPRYGDPTFLYLGRLKRYKGVELVLEAVRRLAREGTAARLIVAGRGEWEPELRVQAARLGIEDRVEFTGFVTEERKRELFRRAWVNVFPSPKEGWGITNLEAAGCATPTVASDSPGLRESVVDGRTGLLVRHGDVDRLTAALREMATNPEKTRTMGAAAHEFARGFTWDRAADLTERHLHEAVSGPRRRLP